MLSRVFRFLFGLGFAVALIFVTFAYVSMQNANAIQTAHGVCMASVNSTSTCFSTAHSLSHQETTVIAVSPDGRIVASGIGQSIQLWSLETGRLVRSLQGHQHRISAIAFSPDGSTLASGSLDGTVQLWNWHTGTRFSRLDSGRVTCMAFSPSGSLLATGSRIPQWPDGKTSQLGVQIWDLATQSRRYSLGEQPISALAFSPNGQLLAGGSVKTQVWQMETQVRLQTFDSGELTSVTFDRTGQMLITASSRIKLWDVQSGDGIDTLKSRSSYLTLSPDGQTLATVNGGTVNLWHLETRRLLGTLRGSWYSRITVAFGLNGQALISSSSDGIRLWRAHTESTAHLEDWLEEYNDGFD